MDSLFAIANDDDQLFVNGRFVRVRDMHRLSDKPDRLPPRVQPDDEDDTFSSDDGSDVNESEPQDEDDKEDVKPVKLSFHPFLPSKTSMSEGDPALENPSNGKGKERARTPTPEPQIQYQTQGGDLLRLLLGRHLEEMYGGPYATIEEPHAKNKRGLAADHEAFEDADFVPRKWGRRDIFASHYMTSFKSKVRSRRPQPEFITGPSRITLDDL